MDTPIIDKAEYAEGEEQQMVVDAFLARTLERKLAQMTAERDGAIEELSNLQTDWELCQSSVVEAMLRFRNVEDYIKQVETQRDALQAAAKKVLFYASPYELGKNLEDALNKLSKLASREGKK